MNFTANSIKPFKIFAGTERGEAIMGNLEIGDRSRLAANTTPTPVSWFDGNLIFPNVFNIWGRRLVDGKVPNGIIDVADKNYTGEVEAMAWGSEGGLQIMCRYLDGQNSIDYYYQVNKLGLPKHNTTEGGIYNYTTLAMGEHEVDTRNKSYAFMLMVHPLNQNSICRSPNAYTFQWKVVDEIAIESDKAKKVTEEFDAVGVVKSAATSGAKLKILFDIIDAQGAIVYDKSDETTLYEGMVVYARNEPTKVQEAVANFKKEVSEVIAKGEAYNAFDLSEKGSIKVKNGESKVAIIKDAPANDKNIKQWFFENVLEPNVFKAYGKLKSMADNNFK